MKWYYILVLSVLVLVTSGLLVFGEQLPFFDHCEAEYWFGGQGEEFYAFMCSYFPDQVLTSINNSAGVILAEHWNERTIIGVNMSEVLISPQEMVDYLDSLEYVFLRNEMVTVTYPGYPIPQCVYDQGTHTVRSVYLFNGQYLVVDDGKC